MINNNTKSCSKRNLPKRQSSKPNQILQDNTYLSWTNIIQYGVYNMVCFSYISFDDLTESLHIQRCLDYS